MESFFHNLMKSDSVLMRFVRRGATHTSRSELSPIDALRRPDADTMLVFLSGNGIQFFKRSEDPWYRATIKGARAYYFENDTVQLYRPEEASSPLGCVQQYQFCNPSLPADNRCGPLASWYDSLLGSSALFNLTEEELLSADFPSQQTGSRFSWLFRQMRDSTANIQQIISSLGARALASQQYLAYGIMGEIPDDQWQLDVSHWFSIYLSSIQAGVVNGALGPSNPALNPYRLLPPNEHVKKLCNNQVRAEDFLVHHEFTGRTDVPAP